MTDTIQTDNANLNESISTSLYPWESLDDDGLLSFRIRDLQLRIEGSVLEGRIERLYHELEAGALSFRPKCYLADEWLCPDRVPVIGIPFYLAHPRLVHLERKMMLEVEGGADAWCMKLLRHEAGHALNYAYRLFARTRWRELFGPMSLRYDTVEYYTRPYSKRYVVHLEDNYAQAHPDEDFAETFAVWLTPSSRWKEKYRDWPAIKKLHYVDHCMRTIGTMPPVVIKYETPWAASHIRSTLAAYYERKRRSLGDEFPGFYDPGLNKIFAPRQDSGLKASEWIRRWRRHIVRSVSLFTGERKFDIDKVVRKLIVRTDALGLFLQKSEAESIAELSAFVTAVMSDIHHFAEKKRKS